MPDSASIRKGDILEVVDAMTGKKTKAMAINEKIAYDGVTELAVTTEGEFILKKVIR